MTALPSPLATALSDHYLIERELGAGGMATVYLARDLKHDRQVALKVLRPELGAVLGRGAVPGRDQDHRPARPSAHPHADRLGRGGGVPLLRAALCAGRVAARSAQPRQAAGHRGGADDHQAGGQRARLRPPPGRGAPGHQAGEHPDPGGRGDAGRFRHRARREGGRGQPAHGDGAVARHAAVHEPGAGDRRPAARCPQRRLQPGRRAVRDAHRRAAHDRADGPVGDRQAAHRAAYPDPHGAEHRAGGRGRRRLQGARQGARRPVRHRRRFCPRARRRDRGHRHRRGCRPGRAAAPATAAGGDRGRRRRRSRRSRSCC